MVKDRLHPKIWEKLIEKSGLKPNSIRTTLTRIKKKYKVTLNAAAYILAQRKKFSVARYLEDKDWDSLRNIEFIQIPVKVSTSRRKKIIEIVNYETENRFFKAHINEINKAYTCGCYTACFILMRKVLENFIVEILRKKYPENKKEHKEKYFNFDKGRYHDFNVLLLNLRKSSKDFGSEKKIVETLCNRASEFKETANDMAHSIYQIARKKDIDERNFQVIIDLIREIYVKHFQENPP